MLIEEQSSQGLLFVCFLYVIIFNILLPNKSSISFTPCVKISEQYLGYYPKYCLFNLKGQNRKSQKSEFSAKSAFQ